MRALDRKLLRDLLQRKTQALAIALIQGCGVATFVLSLSTLQSLQQNQEAYYDRYHFPHVFARLKRAPDALAQRIAEIPGVARIWTRVVADVTLDVPGLSEPAVGRLISLPTMPAEGPVNLHLRAGRTLEPGRKGEVLVGEAFADAHGLKPGHSISAILNGRRQRLTIVGVVLSPEYVYQLREGELLPDDKHFGVFWIGDEDLAAAYDMEGAFNDVTLSLIRGASEPQVLRRLDHLLEPYGGLGAYGRSDQRSHEYVSNEIRQLRAMALITPGIFLGVAAFLVNVVLSRLVATQRESIATLKAFGYTRAEIGIHYLKFVLVISVIGAALGTAAGVWLGRGLTSLYTQFFRFPILRYHLGLYVVAVAVLTSAGAAIGGALGALSRAMRLPPAEAMRPEPPFSYRRTLLERLGLQGFFSHSMRMILREIERRPVKSALTCLGLSLAIAVLVLGTFFEDAVDFIVDFQFLRSQRQDVSIAFVEPASSRALHEVERLPGVLRAEPFRSVPVRLHSGHRSRRVGILGLAADRTLYRLLDEDGREVRLPEAGLLLSTKLAEILGVVVGDRLMVEVMEGERRRLEAPVAAVVTDFAGTSAIMDLRALHRWMREGNPLSGAFLAVDPFLLDDLYRRLKGTPRVSSVTVKTAALRSFEKTIAESLLRMRAINAVFAIILACGIVYNSARISLSERSRDFATLRVLGFSRAEISIMLLGELTLLTIVAIPCGLALGYGLAGVATAALQTEIQRFPLVVYPATYAFSVTVVLAAALLSGIVVRRRLDQLNLVAVLKASD